MYEYKVNRVVKIVDGDTVDLELDLGFHASLTERFRLAGINAPERGKEGYREASEYLKAMLEDAMTDPNKTLYIRSGKFKGKWRRWIGTLMIADTARNASLIVNDKLVKDGHAVYWTY